jgi:hypothetical protein
VLFSFSIFRLLLVDSACMSISLICKPACERNFFATQLKKRCVMTDVTSRPCEQWQEVGGKSPKKSDVERRSMMLPNNPRWFAVPRNFVLKLSFARISYKTRQHETTNMNANSVGLFSPPC